MDSRWIFPLILLPILVLTGCSREDVGAAPPNPDVVASFSGGMITKGQLKEKFDGLMPCCKGRYQGVDGRRLLISEMVLPTVIAQTIKEKKIDLRQNIREEMGNITEELNISFLHMKFHEQILNSDEKYQDLREGYEFQKKRLEGVPLSERYDRLVQLHQKIHPRIADEVKKVSDKYVQKLRREASITKNYDVLKIKVTAEELKDFYRKHTEGLHEDEYRVPEKVRVREIKIEVKKDKEDCSTCIAEKKQKAREKAESVLTELRSGAEFRTVAKKYADGNHEPIKSKWIPRGGNGQEFEEALFSLDIGEISPVLEKENAFSVVKVLERQPGRFKAYEEIVDQIEREYRWQKGEDYLKDNKDRILFTIDGKPYTIGDFIKEYTRDNPPQQCPHMEKMEKEAKKKEKPPQLCDFAHNEFEEQKKIVDRLVDRELIAEDTYNQMIHVEHQEEIEFLTMVSLYPILHKEEMDQLINITDDMVEDYYKKNKETYMYPANAKISIIVIRGGEKKEDKKKALEKAGKAYKELKPSFISFKKGKDFSEVARKYSEDEDTASRGGRLEVDISECRNEIDYMLMHGFHKKIFKLKAGEISDIFEFGKDYYIVQIREMEQKKQIDFEEVRKLVKDDVMNKEHQKVMEKWEDDLLNSAGFVVYDTVLKEAIAETTTTKESQESKGS